MKTKRVACALLYKNGKLLIQSRKGISKYGEEWSFFGGGIKKEEKPIEGLYREMKEELDLDMGKFDMKYLGEIVHYMDNIDTEYHRFLYLIKIPQKLERFNDQEGDGAYFYNFDELKSLKFITNIDAGIALLKINA